MRFGHGKAGLDRQVGFRQFGSLKCKAGDALSRDFRQVSEFLVGVSLIKAGSDGEVRYAAQYFVQGAGE